MATAENPHQADFGGVEIDSSPNFRTNKIERDEIFSGCLSEHNCGADAE